MPNDAFTTTTIAHETGHTLWIDKLSTGARNKYMDLFIDSELNPDAEKPISSYGQRHSHEDFAEAYRTYILQPEKLKAKAPKRYAFMDKNIGKT